jgi:hypothetical protein
MSILRDLNRKKIKHLIETAEINKKLSKKEFNELERRMILDNNLNEHAITEDLKSRYSNYDNDPSVGDMYQRKKKKSKKSTKRKCKCK